MEKEKQNELEGCLKTLFFLEHSIFPDEGCRVCKHLKECSKLYKKLFRLEVKYD